MDLWRQEHLITEQMLFIKKMSASAGYYLKLYVYVIMQFEVANIGCCSTSGYLKLALEDCVLMYT